MEISILCLVMEYFQQLEQCLAYKCSGSISRMSSVEMSILHFQQLERCLAYSKCLGSVSRRNK